MQHHIISRENGSIEHIADLFRSAYLEVGSMGDKPEYFIQDQYKIWFEVDERQRFIRFSLLFKVSDSATTEALLAGVNEINGRFVLFRSQYDGNLIELDYYFWVEGGVTDRGLVAAYKFFSAGCSDVLRALAEKQLLD